MRKHSLLKSVFLFVGMLVITSLSAQVNITGVTDSLAILNEDFTATMLWSPGTGGAPTWSLSLYPSGMSINPSTGVIFYHPTVQDDGGRVTVKATNANGTDTYNFNVYISDGVVCDPDIISYHSMDEAGGTTFEDFANGYTGTSATALSSGVGAVKGAVEQTPSTGTEQYITVPDANQYEWLTTDAFSVSAWINPKGKLNPGALEDQIIWLRVDNSGTDPVPTMIALGLDGQAYDNVLKPKFRIRDSGADTNQTFIPDVPLIHDSLQHIVYCYMPEGGGPYRVRIYLDGIRISNPQFYVDPSAHFAMSGPATIGHMQYPSVSQTQPFNGVIDEVIVFDRAVSDAEVAQMYADGLAGKSHCGPGNSTPEFINSFPPQIDQGGTYSTTLATYDPDGDPVTISVISYPDWMQYNSGTRTFTNKAGRPDNSDIGTEQIVVNADDGTIDVTRAYPIEVININDDPYFTSTQGNASINEDVEFVYNFTFEELDPDDDITVTCNPKPDWLILNTSINRLSGTCTNDDFAIGTSPSEVFPVTLRITDESGAYDEQSFNITVTNVNDAPVISGQNIIQTNEGQAITITPAVAFDEDHITDPDDDFPSDFSITVNPGTNYTVSGGNILDPDDLFSGTLSVPINLSDGQASVSYTLTVYVNFVNIPPVVTSVPPDEADDYELYEYTIVVTDGNPQDIITLRDSILPSWLTFDPESGLVSGTPKWDDVGDTLVWIIFSDGHVEDDHFWTIDVGNDNSLPEITSTPAESWKVGQVYQYTLTATDVDEDDALVFSAITYPDEFLTFTAEATQALLHGVPTTDDIGTHTILLQVSDGQGIDQQAFNLMIIPDALNSNLLSKLMVYPIPASTELNIEYEDMLSGAVFQIINLNGSILTQEILEYGAGRISVDISELKSGLYMYRVITGDDAVTGRFLVE